MAKLPSSLHIFVTTFFVKVTKIPKISWEIFNSMCSVFACLALLSKKVNKLLCNILVTRCQKQPKTKLRKWDEKLTSVLCMLQKRQQVPRAHCPNIHIYCGNKPSFAFGLT